MITFQQEMGFEMSFFDYKQPSFPKVAIYDWETVDLWSWSQRRNWDR